MAELSEALQKAQDALKQARESGKGTKGYVEFSPEEIDVLIEAARRTNEKLVNEDGNPSSSWRVYVKTIAMKYAGPDSVLPIAERKVKTVADIEAEIAKAQERLAKMKAEAAGA